MELARQLAELLIALEAQAAQCAALLDDAPPELVEQVLEAFAPLPAMKGAGARQRETWGRLWLDWIADCGERYEARPMEPSGDDLHRLIVRWAIGTPPVICMRLDTAAQDVGQKTPAGGAGLSS